MNELKLSIVSLIVISLLVFIPQKTTNACGFSEEDLFFGYQFLDMDLMSEKTDFSPFILNFSDTYSDDENGRRTQRNTNLEEWQKASCQIATLEEIEEIIYFSNANDLERLRKAAANNNRPPAQWISNQFAKELTRNKCTETIDYLIYAKMCEPNAISGSEWSDESRLDSNTDELIQYGKSMMMKTDNHFLRLRYMYQIVRLAHYADDYQYALELYNELEPRVDETNSIINWWLLGHKAGCIKRLGDNVTASYLFSRVFKNCEGKREQVFRSFYIDNDDEWKQCLLMCNSDEERATLYALRASGRYSIAVEEMEHIYKISPQSEHLTPLLLREISLLEETFLGAEFRRGDYPGKPDEIAKQRLIRLLTLVRKVLKEDKLQDQKIWIMAQGYLEYLSRDLYAADKTYQKAATIIEGDEKLEKQLELFQLVLKIHAYTRIDENIEVEMFNTISNTQLSPDLSKFIFDRLAALYNKQKDYGKAFLCNFDLHELQLHPKPEIINDLIQLSELEELNKMENYLLENKIGDEFLSRLYELKGTMHLTKNELADATRAFEKVKPTIMNENLFYPFYLPIIDCIHCEHPNDTTIVDLNKLEIVQQILELEYKAKTDMENSAQYYYTLGKVYYNMSYYGHSYGILDYYRSSSSWAQSPDEIDDYSFYYSPHGNKEYTDINLALFYFDKAKELTLDDEAAAKASFMAAKCELIKYYQDPDTKFHYYDDKAPNLPLKYRNYYDILINKYSETAFFEKAVEECKYFSYYLEK